MSDDRWIVRSDETWHETAPLYTSDAEATAEAKRRAKAGFTAEVYKLVKTRHFEAKELE